MNRDDTVVLPAPFGPAKMIATGGSEFCGCSSALPLTVKILGVERVSNVVPLGPQMLLEPQRLHLRSQFDLDIDHLDYFINSQDDVRDEVLTSVPCPM